MKNDPQYPTEEADEWELGDDELAESGSRPAPCSPRFEQFAGFLVPEGHAVFGGMAVHPIIDRETCGPIDGYPKESQWFAVAFCATDQERITAALNGENRVLSQPEIE